ncbi:hypothetical protein AA14337_3268 [Acetobacter malorum DSM 14337]|uniref:DotM C-terminal cytoplasmic domain-containing protein n=1 Tax=Acetobacter malorum DSM 14337 TaxID=1307910 RepID=A0ABQ0Q0L1_9PROT|nr:hypothetical protein [Acetobacter malorum]KXV09890.1 hypothetical protein AD930_02380 [Acetobacter malorum]GBQ86230.1 hypothetical protein AA14337_3268 [Acetobacter malorum DSM 14337]
MAPRPEKAAPLMGSEELVLLVVVLIWLAITFLWPWIRPVVEYIIFINADWQYHLLDKLYLLHDAPGMQAMRYVDLMVGKPFQIGIVPWKSALWVAEDISNFRHMFFGYAAVLGLLFWLTTRNKPKKSYKTVYSLTGKELSAVPYIFGLRVTFKPFRYFLTGDCRSDFIRKLLNIFLKYSGITFLVKTKKEWLRVGPSFFEYQAKAWNGTRYSAEFVPELAGPIENPSKSPQEWMRDNGIEITAGEVNVDQAEKVFISQLGEPWSGIENAPYYMQAVAILSWLNYTDKSGKKANEFRGILDIIHCTSKNPQEAEVSARKHLQKYLGDKEIVAGLNRRGNSHAYLNPAMMTIYGAGGPMIKWEGGASGVNSSGGFRWVKKIDRTFWYCMNNVGREAHHIECAGAVSHFHAERVAGKRLVEPYVASAIEGLEITVREDGVMSIKDYFHERTAF